MTYNELVYKLRAEGFTDQQINSKVADAIISIWAEVPEFLNVKDKIKEINKEIESHRFEQMRKEAEYEHMKDELADKAKELNNFKKELEECTTEKAKDKMRLARFFIENTAVTNGYERTAYIKGLSNILGCEAETDEEAEE